MLKYFSYRIVYSSKLKQEQSHLIVAPPHGVLPLGNLLAITFMHSYLGFDLHGVAASMVFRLPVMKSFFVWLGCIDASSQTMSKVFF
jgi:hypothetical protein